MKTVHRLLIFGIFPLLIFGCNRENDTNTCENNFSDYCESPTQQTSKEQNLYA